MLHVLLSFKRIIAAITLILNEDDIYLEKRILIALKALQKCYLHNADT